MSSRRRSSGGGRSTLRKGMPAMSVLEKRDYATQMSHQSTTELLTNETKLVSNV